MEHYRKELAEVDRDLFGLSKDCDIGEVCLEEGSVGRMVCQHFLNVLQTCYFKLAFDEF